MCGFVGFFGGVASHGQVGDEAILKCMADTIIYRGPDDAGYWCDVDHRVALGHRRLSVVDLSSQGHQPMVSTCGRYVIAFNGEVYNFEEIRTELKKSGASPAWRGHSDTEVMLAAIASWGLEAALKKFVGMFAFALWDHQNSTLILARDRFGEKPLYYGSPILSLAAIVPF